MKILGVRFVLISDLPILARVGQLRSDCQLLCMVSAEFRIHCLDCAAHISGLSEDSQACWTVQYPNFVYRTIRYVQQDQSGSLKSYNILDIPECQIHLQTPSSLYMPIQQDLL